MKTLHEIVREKPFLDYQLWWPVGDQFSTFMGKAIVEEWRLLPRKGRDLAPVQTSVDVYLDTVYDRGSRSTLVKEFANLALQEPLWSGEFDGLSYAFYRSGFELLAAQFAADPVRLATERRLLTQRIGRRFFDQVAAALELSLPAGLENTADFNQLKTAVARVGHFLSSQGYLRDHFAFHFDVQIDHAGRPIAQSERQFLTYLHQHGVGFALYEMGYPIILPSAVYLFHTMGEAQHHSSRTIEELFAQVGYVASETDDFDPTGYPSELVVELWEIRGMS